MPRFAIQVFFSGVLFWLDNRTCRLSAEPSQRPSLGERERPLQLEHVWAERKPRLGGPVDNANLAVTFIIDAHHAQPVTSVMVVRDGAVHPCEMLPLPFNGLKDMRSSKIGLRFSVEGGFHEYGGETISISPKQFIMISLAKLRVGARLIVEMRIPLEIPGGMFNEVRVAGVIICGCKLAGGNFGYQVEMEHH